MEDRHHQIEKECEERVEVEKRENRIISRQYEELIIKNKKLDKKYQSLLEINKK